MNPGEAEKIFQQIADEDDDHVAGMEGKHTTSNDGCELTMYLMNGRCTFSGG